MEMAFFIIWIALGSGFGYFLCKAYKTRMDMLFEACKFTKDLQSNVESFKLPLEEFVEKYPFKTKLCELVKEGKHGDYIESEYAEEMMNLLCEINICETKTVLAKIESLEKKTCELYKTAKEDYVKKGVTYQKLGVLLGLLIGILWL